MTVASLATTARPPWSVRIAERLGLGIGGTFVAVTLVLACLPTLNVVWAVNVADYQGSEVFNTLVKIWVNAAAMGYVYAFLVWAVYRTREEMMACEPMFEHPDFTGLVAQVTAEGSARAILLGASVGFTVFVMLNLVFFDGWEVLTGGEPLNLLYAWSSPLYLVVWLSLFYCVTILAVMTNRLGKASTDHMRVDLLDVDALAAIPAIGVRLTLAAAVGLTAVIVQIVLTREVHIFDWLPPTIVVVVFGSWTILRPLVGTHRAIACAKTRELERIDQALAECGPRDIEAITSARFARLMLWRNTVEDTSEWPLSRSSVARLLFYVVLPPAAWLVAVSIEVLVEIVLN